MKPFLSFLKNITLFLVDFYPGISKSIWKTPVHESIYHFLSLRADLLIYVLGVHFFCGEEVHKSLFDAAVTSRPPLFLNHSPSTPCASISLPSSYENCRVGANFVFCCSRKQTYVKTTLNSFYQHVQMQVHVMVFERL